MKVSTECRLGLKFDRRSCALVLMSILCLLVPQAVLGDTDTKDVDEERAEEISEEANGETTADSLLEEKDAEAHEEAHHEPSEDASVELSDDISNGMIEHASEEVSAESTDSAVEGLSGEQLQSEDEVPSSKEQSADDNSDRSASSQDLEVLADETTGSVIQRDDGESAIEQKSEDKLEDTSEEMNRKRSSKGVGFQVELLSGNHFVQDSAFGRFSRGRTLGVGEFRLGVIPSLTGRNLLVDLAYVSGHSSARIYNRSMELSVVTDAAVLGLTWRQPVFGPLSLVGRAGIGLEQATAKSRVDGSYSYQSKDSAVLVDGVAALELSDFLWHAMPSSRFVVFRLETGYGYRTKPYNFDSMGTVGFGSDNEVEPISVQPFSIGSLDLSGWMVFRVSLGIRF